MAVTTQRVLSSNAPVASSAAALLVHDPWLSERLNAAAFTLPATADSAVEPVTRPAFLQTKVGLDLRQRVEELVRAGYMLVETAVTLRKDIGASAPLREQVRFAAPSDEASVRDIAGTVFTFTRFHRDPAIPTEVANRIKQDWAGNFFHGRRGTHMVLAEDAGLVVGFLLLIAREDELIIDLVGVAEHVQGRGFGRAMLDFAAANVRGPRYFVVGTQLCNMPSLAYYNRYGFVIEKASYTLHRHVR